MGAAAQAMLARAADALVQSQPGMAAHVIADDLQLDLIERRTEAEAIALIARRQPVARDLRTIVCVLRVAAEVERVGDLAKNTAKRVQSVHGSTIPKPLVLSFKRIANLASERFQTVLDALLLIDDQKALSVWSNDDDIDDMYTAIFRELLTYMMEDPRYIGVCTHLLFCAKNMERVGDHATNIAEFVHYVATGEMLSTDRPKGSNEAYDPLTAWVPQIGAPSKTEARSAP
jgi:phosphate transport system protein